MKFMSKYSTAALIDIMFFTKFMQHRVPIMCVTPRM